MKNEHLMPVKVLLAESWQLSDIRQHSGLYLKNYL